MSIRFDAATDAAFRTADLPAGPANFLITGWYYHVANPAAIIDLLQLTDGAGATEELAVSATGNLVLRGAVADNIVIGALTAGAWHRVGLLNDGSTLYGVLFGASPASRAAPASFTPAALTLGGNTVAAANGRLAAVKCWSGGTYTLNDLLNELNTYTPRNTSGLYGWWPMFPGATERLRDYSGNGRNLTANGTLSDEDGPPLSWGAPVHLIRNTGDTNEAPELVAGTATLGTVNGYLVQAEATAATGGAGTITQKWQRSPRDADTWSDLTGKTALTLRDNTVTASTNYDYRVEYTDGVSTVHSNTIQADVPASAPAWGIIGASNTDEYRADDDRAGGTAWEATTLNWLELLVNERSLNAGAWSDVSRGEPRRAGYEFNWARSSAYLVDMEGAQLTGLTAQISSGAVTHVVCEPGTNDWDESQDPDFFDQMYNSADGGVHTQDGRLVADLVSDYLTRAQAIMDAVLEAGAAGVLFFGLPHYMDYPTAPLMGYTDPVRRGYHNAVMDQVNDAIESYCASLNAQYGYTVAVYAWWDQYLNPDIWDTSTGTEVTIAGVQVTAGVSPDGSPQYLFVDNHASTIVCGLVANAFVGAANNLDGIALATFSDAEILANAGIDATTITGDGAVTLPALTAAGTGSLAVSGTGAATLPALSVSGAGTVAISGTGAAILPALTAAGIGTVAITGTGAVTLPELVASGSTSQTTTAEGAVTLPALVASGTGVVEIQAAGVVTLPALTAGGTATTLVQGSGNVSLPALTVAGTAVVAITGAGAVTLPMLVVVGSETVTEPATSTGDVDLSVSGSELVELALSGTELVAFSISGLPVVSFTLSSSLP